MSTISEIAAGVVEELNAGVAAAAFSQTFEAARAYIASFEPEKFAVLTVTVVPRDLAVTAETRAQSRHDYRVDVGVQKKVSDDLAEVDELMTLMEELADYLERRKLTSVAGALWLGTANEPVYDPALLHEDRLFTSVLMLSYRMMR